MFDPVNALRARILAATDRAELDAIALDLEGLAVVDAEDPETDQTTTTEEARALLLAALDD